MSPHFLHLATYELASLTVAGVVVPMLFASPAFASEPSRPSGRNAVLILLDDLRKDTPSFNGGPAKTPCMDRLAAGATNFRNAMTTVGLCSPARATLFTGRYGHQTGLDDNCQVWHSRLLALPDEETTLVEWTHQAGYFVGCFGKWHLGTDGPIRRGSDRYSRGGFERHRARYFEKPHEFETVQRFYEPGREFAQKPGYYGTREGAYEDTGEHADTVAACAFLREAHQLGRSFFLSVGYHAPHPPYVVPKPFDAMYDPTRITLPANFLHRSPDKPRYQNDPLWYWHDVGHLRELDWRRMHSHYCGLVSLADRAVGELLSTLEQLGLLDKTLIILAGDQGSMLGEHALYDKGPYCYEELMRIPLLVHVPGAEPGTVDRQVSLIDINQTIVDWLGLRPESRCRSSRSLLPLARQEPGAWRNVADEAFYCYEWYNGKWFGIRAVRTPLWKYCWNPVGIDELYDLANDPGERVNRIDDPAVAAVQKRLQQRLRNHLEETSDPLAERFQATRLVADEQ